jgi:hypothetical protein
MLTPREWIQDKNRAPYLWVSGLDLFKYLLQGDITQTAYGCTEMSDHDHFGEFKRAMTEHVHDTSFDQIQHDVLSRPKNVYKEISADTGDLDIGAYVANDTKKFTDNQRKRVYKHALTLVLDFGFNYSERNHDEMNDYHKQVYAVAFKAFSEKRPCRVIAAMAIQCSEIPDGMRYYIVLKDFSEPLYPGVWGVFQNNAYSNSFVNVLQDYILGTHDLANGHVCHWNIAKDMPDGSEIIVLPRPNAKITYEK